MARVRVFGQSFNATPVIGSDGNPKMTPDGNWIMTAHAHTARCVPGSEIEVHPDEVIEMAAAETPETEVADSQAQLEAAMAEERKTLTPVAELLKKGADIRHDAPNKVEVSDVPV